MPVNEHGGVDGGRRVPYTREHSKRGARLRSWLATLVLVGACEADPPARRAQEIVESTSERIEAVRSSREEAVLRSVEVYGAGVESAAGVRVVLGFDGAPLFRQSHLPAQGVLPARIAIELEEAEWGEHLPVSWPVGYGGLERVRLATPNPRVVLDLRRGGSGRVFYLTDPYRIVIDVGSGPTSSPRSRLLVVLDPGHGGSEPGAANDQHALVESELALELARLTAARLRRIMPRAEVMLTRKQDEHLSLEERCALANAMEADAFVSIHLNASSEPVRRGGVTTFVLDTTNDRQALRLAARENGTRVAEVNGIQGLLAKYHRQGQARGSSVLARKVQRHTLRSGRKVLPSLADRGVRRAMFYVLVGARMPAILLEASFLTHDPEARALARPAYRGALAQGIASGIAAYLRER